jgi:hypothetical protein
MTYRFGAAAAQSLRRNEMGFIVFRSLWLYKFAQCNL